MKKKKTKKPRVVKPRGIDLHLSKSCKITQAITIANGAAGTSNIDGVTLDMQDFENVLIIVNFGAIVGGALTSIKAQRGEASNLSDAADILGSSQTIADTDDNKTFYIDIIRPAERYVRVQVLRGTQAATCNATYIQYGAHLKPVTQPTGVAGEAFVDATEGTA